MILDKEIIPYGYLFKETISFIKQYCSSNRSVIIIGDFNLLDINWLSLVGSTNVSNIFCDFVFECDSQLVTVPTHCEGNCLDLVLTNSPHAINNGQVGSCSVMKSDHLLVSFSRTTQFRPSFNVHETQYVINFSKLNYLKLAEYILDLTFHLVLTVMMSRLFGAK